jgi:hypothetical protein
MRSFSTSILDELEKEEFKTSYLLKMTIGGTDYLYTNYDVLINLDGEIYEPLAFKFNAVNYNMNSIVDSVSLDIDNLDSGMTSLFVGSTVQGSAVELRLVALNSDNNPVGNTSAILFQGEIDKWNLDENILKVTFTSQFVRWQQITFSYHSASCRWKAFKSTECNYTAGSTWCDRSYTRCVALNNSSNFGGFRWLPSLENTTIYFGEYPQRKPGLDVPDGAGK